MTKTIGNYFYIVNLYFPCHFVNAFGLAVLSNRPSSFTVINGEYIVKISNFTYIFYMRKVKSSHNLVQVQRKY